jgi:hypothetical protein
LKFLKTDLNEVQQVVLTLKTDLDDVQSTIKHFPKTLADLDAKVNNATKETTTRIDVLSLQTADLAVELDRLQSLTNDAASNNEMMLTDADIKHIINLSVDKKLQTLPSIIKHELDNSPVIKNLHTSSKLASIKQKARISCQQTSQTTGLTHPNWRLPTRS